MRLLLVTGSRGFIGTNFCNYILDNFHDIKIISIDKRTYAANYSIKESDRFVDYAVDISDKQEVEKVFKEVYKMWCDKCDVLGIINFAAESHVDNSIVDPEPFLNANYNGVFNLLNLWKKYFNDKRFLQISTDEVYGSVDKASVETDMFNPSSIYSATKAGAEHLVNAFHTTYSLDTVITRCGNNYGPYQDKEKFIPKIISNAINENKIPVYGDGKNIRQWTYVMNHVSDIWNVFMYGKSGEVYNVGGGHHITNIELAELIVKKLQKKTKGLIEFVEDRKGHDKMYSIDCDKLKTLKAPSPNSFDGEFVGSVYTSFERGLDDTIMWYCEKELLNSGIKVLDN